jgi:tetratricopeptide (TPR) repeat protein
MRTLLLEARRTLDAAIPQWARQNAGELGYMSVAAVGVMALAGATAAYWFSPWSPAALDRPATTMATGDLDGAMAEYQQLADGWGPDSIREEAAWRAAQLQAVELDNPTRSAVMLRQFIAAWPDSAHEADAWARLASVYDVGHSDHTRAARAWEQAAWANPTDPEAGRWLLEAGRGYAVVGDNEGAERALGLATEHTDRAAPAWLALARLHLATEPAAAYEAYDMALRAADGGPAANLARLGLATALERLEGGDAALAQLDEAMPGGVGDAALVRRRQRLRANR